MNYDKPQAEQSGRNEVQAAVHAENPCRHELIGLLPNPDFQKAAIDLGHAQAMARHCGQRADELEKQAYVQREAAEYWQRQAQALGAVVHG